MIYPSRVVSIDFETTGPSVSYDLPVQLAAAVLEDGKVVGEPFSTYIKPDMGRVKISLEALSINAGDLLTTEGVAKVGSWINKLKDAPSPMDVAGMLKDWANKHDAANIPNIAHKADFDMPIMVSRIYCWRSVLKHPPLSPIWIDTLAMAQQVLSGEMKAFGISSLCAYFGLTRRGEQHDALQDMVLGGQCYFKLRDLLTGKAEPPPFNHDDLMQASQNDGGGS